MALLMFCFFLVEETKSIKVVAASCCHSGDKPMAHSASTAFVFFPPAGDYRAVLEP